MVLQSLSGLPAFLIYFVVAAMLVAVYLYVYLWITPHDELALIRADKPGAAIALGLSMIGFALPLTSSIAHSDNVVDMVIWGLIAPRGADRCVLPGAHSDPRSFAAHRERRDWASALARRRLGHRRSRQRGLDDHMKRSGQVALVLMGLTGTTAAGAYMMPSRPECRPAPAASTTLNPPNAATPLAPAAAEPCRRRSWSGWRWNSCSSNRSGYSGGWFSRSSAPTSVSTALTSSGRSGTSTSTSRSWARPRGDFGRPATGCGRAFRLLTAAPC